MAEQNIKLCEELAELRAEHRRLQAAHDRLREQLDTGLGDLHAAMVGALLNGHLRAEAPVLVRAVVEADRRWRANPTADGWTEVPLAAIGQPVFARPGEPAPPPLRSPDTIPAQPGHDRQAPGPGGGVGPAGARSGRRDGGGGGGGPRNRRDYRAP